MPDCLMGKNILWGVTGSIAAYKAAEVVSTLTQGGAKVQVIMTRAACEFVSPLTFESLSGQAVITDLFRPGQWEIQHIAVADRAHLLVIAPATANILGKLVHGIVDDALLTIACAVMTRVPCILAPAMNTHMWENPIVQDNVKKLQQYGYYFIEPGCGRLACGTVGAGRLAEPSKIVDFIREVLTRHENFGHRRPDQGISGSSSLSQQ